MTNEADGYILFDFENDPRLEGIVTQLFQVPGGRVELERFASNLSRTFPISPYTYLLNGDPVVEILKKRGFVSYPLINGFIYNTPVQSGTAPQEQ